MTTKKLGVTDLIISPSQFSSLSHQRTVKLKQHNNTTNRNKNMTRITIKTITTHNEELKKSPHKEKKRPEKTTKELDKIEKHKKTKEPVEVKIQVHPPSVLELEQTKKIEQDKTITELKTSIEPKTNTEIQNFNCNTEKTKELTNNLHETEHTLLIQSTNHNTNKEAPKTPEQPKPVKKGISSSYISWMVVGAAIASVAAYIWWKRS